MKAVYLAGPDVFRPDAIALGDLKKKLCLDFGFKGLFPFDNQAPADVADLSTFIYQANVAMIQKADFAIFNLTPFRGPSADVGTVFELGMTIALGKPAFAYSNDSEDFMARLHRNPGLVFDVETKTWRDSLAMAAEDFGNVDNLMIDASLAVQGRRIHRHAVDPEVLYSNLTGFRDCLKEAKGYFQSVATRAA